MKRTILSKIALALGALAIGLTSVGHAKAADPSTFQVMSRCESNGIRVAGIHGIYNSPVAAVPPTHVFYATYLMKYLPPNWVYTGRMNGFTAAPHNSALNSPQAMDIFDIIGAQRFAISEPGTYFVWVLFASSNGNGGYDYHWKYSNVCTIKGSVFAGPGAAKARKVKKAKKKPVKVAPRPTTPPVAVG